MIIVTWNLNSIRARMQRLLAWLEKHNPDVVCLQETKVIDDDFPAGELMAAGYHSAFVGQKSYNGVAILSRKPLKDVGASLGDEGDNSQARIITGKAGVCTVVSVYVPNGKSPGTEHYRFKLSWLQRLREFLDRQHTANQSVVLCGDFNVAPEDRDVHDPLLWEGEILCTDAERKALQNVVDFGFCDAFRLHHEEGGLFSWWDYRMLGFPKNRGLRIDHIYVTKPLVHQCTMARIDRDERKGKLPSDHAPVLVELDL